MKLVAAAALLAVLLVAPGAGADVTQRALSNVTVSPDGTHIAWTDGDTWKIWEARADGSDAHVVAPAPTGEGISDMRWTEAGLVVDSNFTLYLVRPGAKARVVIPGTYGGFDFAASRTRVATGLERAPGPYVVTDIATGKSWRLGSPKTLNHYGTLSPDGNRAAWTGRGSVLVARLGGPVHRLAAKAACPAWSPDGTSIAFMRNADLRVMPAGGGRSRLLVAHAGSCAGTVWSPDSSTIAYEDPSGLILVDARTGAVRHLPKALGQTYYPAWAPNGTLYVSSRPKPDVGGDCLNIATAAGTVVVRGCP